MTMASVDEPVGILHYEGPDLTDEQVAHVRERFTKVTCAPAADLPIGDCVCTSSADGIHVDRADPRVLIGAETLDAIIDHPESNVFVDLSGCTSNYDGALLKILGTNRTVVYRIVTWMPRMRAFVAEWPD